MQGFQRLSIKALVIREVTLLKLKQANISYLRHLVICNVRFYDYVVPAGTFKCIVEY